MNFLTVDEILAANDLPTEIVHIPEWGGNVKIQGLTRAAFDAINKAAEVAIPATGPGQQATTRRDEDRFSEALFIACVLEPKFTEEHLPALRQKSLGALNRVYQAIGRILQTEIEPVKSPLTSEGA